MNELQLIIDEGMVVRGSQEEKILHSILNGCRELEIFGIRYAITHVESKITKSCSFFVDKTSEHKITAARLVPQAF